MKPTHLQSKQRMACQVHRLPETRLPMQRPAPELQPCQQRLKCTKKLSAGAFSNGKMDFLVIVDFEATCDEGYEKAILIKEQEIIEFPWVIYVFNTSTTLIHRISTLTRWLMKEDTM